MQPQSGGKMPLWIKAHWESGFKAGKAGRPPLPSYRLPDAPCSRCAGHQSPDKETEAEAADELGEFPANTEEAAWQAGFREGARIREMFHTVTLPRVDCDDFPFGWLQAHWKSGFKAAKAGHPVTCGCADNSEEAEAWHAGFNKAMPQLKFDLEPPDVISGEVN